MEEPHYTLQYDGIAWAVYLFPGGTRVLSAPTKVQALLRLGREIRRARIIERRIRRRNKAARAKTPRKSAITYLDRDGKVMRNA